MRMARQIQTWTCILSARDAASSARGTRLPRGYYCKLLALFS